MIGVCTASPHVHNWRVDRVVPWRGKSHINTLELGTIGILERDLAITHPRSRFTALVDSSVAKASSAKGRSTSLALQPGLRRAAAHQIGFELTPPLALHPRGSTLPMIRPARLLASRFTSICLYLSCILSAGSAFDASSRRGPGFSLSFLLLASALPSPFSLHFPVGLRLFLIPAPSALWTSIQPWAFPVRAPCLGSSLWLAFLALVLPFPLWVASPPRGLSWALLEPFSARAVLFLLDFSPLAFLPVTAPPG